MPLNFTDSLKLLRNANRQLTVNTKHQAVKFERVELKKLSETVTWLGQATATRRLFCPEEYRQTWQEFIAGRIAEFPPKAARYLCWEADIATDPRFLLHLSGLGTSLTGRSLQGLVYSQHSRWSDDLVSNLKKIRGFIDAYTGRNHLVNKWRDSYALMLAYNSPQTVAQRIYTARQTPAAFCQEFSLSEQTSFINQVVNHLADLFFSLTVSNDTAKAYFFDTILTWQHLALGNFKRIIEQALLHKVFSTDIRV